MYCKPADHWSTCAANVKAAMKASNDPAIILEAGAEWAERYRRLYLASPQPTWTQGDDQLLADALAEGWDSTVGQYLDPVDLAYDFALKSYFPKLAAALGILSGPLVIFFQALLAPSPIANDFTAAEADNEEIATLAFAKLSKSTENTIRLNYPALFSNAYEKAKGHPPVFP